MKYVKQFAIIILISLAGEFLKSIIDLPIPASIYGMLILFCGLTTGVIKPDSVKSVGKFLIEAMPVMFIPAAVGLIPAWNVLKPIIFPVCIIMVVTIVTVMAATGRTAQFVIDREEKRRAKHGK